MLNEKIKIFHLSDIHLDSEFSLNNILGYNFSKRREEIWKTFEDAFKFAKEEGVEIVLISGDLYENDFVTISSLDRIAIIFNKFKDIKVLITLGNHDFISSKSEYLKSIVHENVYIFSNKLEFVDYKYIRIYGFSWDRRNYVHFPININNLNNNYFNVLSLHGMTSSNSEYLPIDIKNPSLKEFDYIALGHIHKPTKVTSNMYYCGSIEPLSFNNTGAHGGLLIEVERKDFHVDFIPLAKRNYEIIEIDSTEILNNQELYDLIKNKLKSVSTDDIIKIIVKGSKREILDLIQMELILKSEFELIEISDETTLHYNIEDLIYKNKDNLIGKYFDFIFDNYKDEELKELIKIGIESFPLENNNEN